MKAPLSALAWAIAVSAAGGVGRAQMGHTADTLEALVAKSRLVVRARVVEVERGEVVDQRARSKVVLHVVETIKGPARRTYTFHKDIYKSDHIYEGWRREGREALWFFAAEDDPRGPGALGLAPDRPLFEQYVYRLGPAVAEEKGFKPRPRGFLIMDLTAVDRVDDILNVARAAAPEGSPEVMGLDVPRWLMQRTGESGDANRLGVPVDRRLEVLARRLIASPGDFVSTRDFVPAKDDAGRKLHETWLRSECEGLRLQGVRALRPFKSEGNIALLRPLLDDPAKWGVARYDEGLPVEIGKEYPIRKAAYEVLRAWGVDVARPVTDEPPAKPPRGASR